MMDPSPVRAAADTNPTPHNYLDPSYEGEKAR